MGVERQVVAGHVDVVVQKGGDALLFPAGDGGGFAFPEHAVVDEQQLRALLCGTFDGGTAGGNGDNDFFNFFRAFDLEAVGCIVFKLGGLQGVVAPGKDFAAGCHDVSFCGLVWLEAV